MNAYVIAGIARVSGVYPAELPENNTIIEQISMLPEEYIY